jgi:hypothetical protein
MGEPTDCAFPRTQLFQPNPQRGTPGGSGRRAKAIGITSCIAVSMPPPTKPRSAWSKLSPFQSATQEACAPIPLKRFSRRPGKRL